MNFKSVVGKEPVLSFKGALIVENMGVILLVLVLRFISLLVIFYAADYFDGTPAATTLMPRL
jgi:NADH:ubiquinone oxidoreductase subunit 5 (subunit L)/multisubunit Na+/H+ antiporter MnhA subunit